MPILKPEPDCYPETLLDQPAEDAEWFLVYTKSRQEKALMRNLRDAEIAHYAPQVPKRYRSPAGRVRTSMVPLFANYVFMVGDDEQRHTAAATGNTVNVSPIEDGDELLEDLLQIRSLISIDVPMTIEGRVGPGQRVRVRNGSFAGYEGVVDRRDAETRLIVCVQFMDQGVSVKLDDCQLEVI